MTRPDDIPEDVWAAAVKAMSHETLGSLYAGPRVEKVARAILAERQRCADVAGGVAKAFACVDVAPTRQGAALDVAKAIHGVAHAN